MSEERKHHELSPSNWPFWAICPHWAGAGQSAASKAGTAKHEQLEDALNERITGVPAASAVDPSVEWAADKIVEMCQKAGNYSITTEQRLEFAESADVPPVLSGIYGYADALAESADSGHVFVFDYKSGSFNGIDYMTQLKGYAAMYMSQHPNVKTGTAVVVYGASREVATMEFSRAEAEDVSVIAVTGRINKEQCQPHMGPQCAYCARRLECKAVADACRELEDNKLGDMHPALLYEYLSSLKSAIEAELENLKETARSSGGCLECGDVKYAFKRDARGRVKSNDINGMFNQLAYTLGVSGSQDEFYDLVGKASLAKKDFSEWAKAVVKKHGKKLAVKDIDAIYAGCSSYGEPAEKFIRIKEEA